MKNNVANAIKKMNKINQSALEKTFNIFIRTIKESNDIDYKPLNVLEEYYDGYSFNSFDGIIIFECYTLIQIIKKYNITDNNYISKEKVFDNAVKSIEGLTPKKLRISMLPKPSRVLYVLKYYLHHHFNIDKDTTKAILDVVTDKNPKNSRMPRNNEDFNEEIKLSNDVNDYKFNTTEGREKWQYFNLSIFILQEFKEFRNIVYDDDLLHKIADEEFTTK